MTDGPGALRVVTLAERPDLREALDDHNAAAWPEFMLHFPVAGRLWHHLEEDFAVWQLLLLDADDRIAAAGNSAPLAWDGVLAVKVSADAATEPTTEVLAARSPGV